MTIKGNNFSPLADLWHAALLKPDKIALPVEQLFGIVRKQVDTSCAGIARQLDRAHRIVLQDDFTELAARFSCLPPSMLLEAYKTAIMPFDTLWIEWNDQVRNKTVLRHDELIDPAAPTRVGMLIYPYTLNSDDNSVATYDVSVISGYPDDRVAPSSVGYVFSLDETRLTNPDPAVPPLSDLAIRQQDRLIGFDVDPLKPLGRSYWERVLRLHRDEVSKCIGLAVRASPIAALPFGRLQVDAIKHFGETSKQGKRQIQWLQACTDEQEGNWRWLISVLALLAYKPDSRLVVDSPGAKGRTQFVKGKFLPAYEYRVVELTKPAEKVLEQRVREFTASSARRRWHTVEAHWAYSHKHGDPDCPHEFIARLDDEGQQRGKQQQICPKCGRIRWHKKAHPRGDKSLGIIDKGYEIRAKSGSRAHRTERVIETLGEKTAS